MRLLTLTAFLSLTAGQALAADVNKTITPAADLVVATKECAQTAQAKPRFGFLNRNAARASTCTHAHVQGQDVVVYQKRRTLRDTNFIGVFR